MDIPTKKVRVSAPWESEDLATLKCKRDQGFILAQIKEMFFPQCSVDSLASALQRAKKPRKGKDAQRWAQDGALSSEVKAKSKGRGINLHYIYLVQLKFKLLFKSFGSHAKGDESPNIFT